MNSAAVERLVEDMSQLIQIVPGWALASVAALLIFAKFYFSNRKHKIKIRCARKSLKTLRAIAEPSKKFAYLRKVDPFVFEEMILTALKDSGYKIKRNKRYTGDGGIDGRVTINGRKVLIQAKRYAAHISAQHVYEFEQLCQRENCKGIFVHTGRTGAKAKVYSDSPTIHIISGTSLLRLIHTKLRLR